MEIQVRSGAGTLIWARSTTGGFTSPAYGRDSTLKQIREALELALYQCNGELAIANDADGVGDIGAAATQVNGDVPVPSTRGGDLGR